MCGLWQLDIISLAAEHQTKVERSISKRRTRNDQSRSKGPHGLLPGAIHSPPEFAQ
jgi:hypothetical protein